ncbi:hypothetical protein MAA5396_04758 [Marinovum algicola]|uniref:Secreted protein n=1 Tax=Marinovum algicola TaxID=42444 RepID=A0A975WEN0_9RHOB|nr:hypothetical protein [Marinovum algicola]SEK08276.1 hypothetical protein SAMN04487940_12629 [Marinovum algicola]SLN76563.1 hypothetical protein MAA5396_04758 [Marinovum algicola]
MTKPNPATAKAYGLSRRNLLAAVPAVAIAPAAAAVAAPGAQDKHPQWLAEYYETQRVWELAEEDTPREEFLFELWHEMQRQFCRTRATTIEGIAAQAEWLVHDAEDYWACEDQRILVENILAALQGLMEADA